MSFTFISETPTGPVLRRLSLTGLCRLENPRLVDVPGGVELRAEMANRPGEWTFSSPGGLCTVLSRKSLVELVEKFGR